MRRDLMYAREFTANERLVAAAELLADHFDIEDLTIRDVPSYAREPRLKALFRNEQVATLLDRICEELGLTKPESEEEDETPDDPNQPFMELGLTKEQAKVLRKAGFETPEAAAAADDDDLKKLPKIGVATIEKLRGQPENE